jgi:hypothetical protein
VLVGKPAAIDIESTALEIPPGVVEFIDKERDMA